MEPKSKDITAGVTGPQLSHMIFVAKEWLRREMEGYGMQSAACNRKFFSCLRACNKKLTPSSAAERIKSIEEFQTRQERCRMEHLRNMLGHIDRIGIGRHIDGLQSNLNLISQAISDMDERTKVQKSTSKGKEAATPPAAHAEELNLSPPHIENEGSGGQGSSTGAANLLEPNANGLHPVVLLFVQKHPCSSRDK